MVKCLAWSKHEWTLGFRFSFLWDPEPCNQSLPGKAIFHWILNHPTSLLHVPNNSRNKTNTKMPCISKHQDSSALSKKTALSISEPCSKPAPSPCTAHKSITLCEVAPENSSLVIAKAPDVLTCLGLSSGVLQLLDGYYSFLVWPQTETQAALTHQKWWVCKWEGTNMETALPDIAAILLCLKFIEILILLNA